MYRANVVVTLRKSILDPQGKAIEHSLHALGFTEAHDVHLGKYIELALDDLDSAAARERTNEMCRKLLANGVIEDYRFELAE